MIFFSFRSNAFFRVPTTILIEKDLCVENKSVGQKWWSQHVIVHNWDRQILYSHVKGLETEHKWLVSPEVVPSTFFQAVPCLNFYLYLQRLEYFPLNIKKFYTCLFPRWWALYFIVCVMSFDFFVVSLSKLKLAELIPAPVMVNLYLLLVKQILQKTSFLTIRQWEVCFLLH